MLYYTTSLHAASGTKHNQTELQSDKSNIVLLICIHVYTWYMSKQINTNINCMSICTYICLNTTTYCMYTTTHIFIQTHAHLQCINSHTQSHTWSIQLLIPVLGSIKGSCSSWILPLPFPLVCFFGLFLCVSRHRQCWNRHFSIFPSASVVHVLGQSLSSHLLKS